MEQFGEARAPDVMNQIPMENVQKKVETETTQSVSGAPIYHPSEEVTYTTTKTFSGRTSGSSTETRTTTQTLSGLADKSSGKFSYANLYGSISTGHIVTVKITSTSSNVDISRSYITGDTTYYITLYVDYNGSEDPPVSATVSITYRVPKTPTGSDSFSMNSEITNIIPSSGTRSNYSFSVSWSGKTATISVTSSDVNVAFSEVVRVFYKGTSSAYYSSVSRTINLGSDKYVTSATVVSHSSGASVSATPTTHGATVSLYWASSSTITATIKLEYYYYETVKEAKVKFNGVVYKHIKLNGQVVV